MRPFVSLAPAPGLVSMLDVAAGYGKPHWLWGGVEASGVTSVGERVRQQRQHQAEFLAAQVQARQLADANERIVVLGEFNAFAFNDGYVDVMNVLGGTPSNDD